MQQKMKIGELLVQAGVIDSAQLESALGEQRQWGERLGLTLVTTTKDAVRLEGLVNPDAGWSVVDVRLDVEGGWLALLQHLHPEILTKKESGTAR